MVLGQGAETPDLLVIGEAPGDNEAKAGVPFIGRSGSLLRRTLDEVDPGLQVYYDNACTCHPVNNKTPSIRAYRACRPRLVEVIKGLTPKKILFVGGTAFRSIAELEGITTRAISKVRGIEFTYKGIPCMATWHPAYILRDPGRYDDWRQDIQRFIHPGTRPANEGSITIEIKDDDYNVLEKIEQATTGEVIAVDLETTGLDERIHVPTLLALTNTTGIGYCVKWGSKACQEILDRIHNKRLVFHNGKFDLRFLNAYTNRKWSMYADTMLLDTLTNEAPGVHGLGDLMLRYLGKRKQTHRLTEGGPANTPWPDLVEYAGADVEGTYAVWQHLWPKTQELLTQHSYLSLIHRASNYLVEVERKGIRVDLEKAKWFSKVIAKEAWKLREEIETIELIYMDETGEVRKKLNPNSWQQVSHYLYVMKGYKKLDPTAPGTDEDSLAWIIEQYDDPVASKITRYRKLNRLNGTYLLRIHAHVHVDSRFHANYRIIGTETGRTSSGGGDPKRNPTGPINIQNIYRSEDSAIKERILKFYETQEEPEDDFDVLEFQQAMRSLFIPDEGKVLIQVDADAGEVRMAAHYSKDERLVEECNQRMDIHGLVAVEAFHLPVELEPPETLKQRVEEAGYKKERFLAKTAVFASLYGAGPRKIALAAGVDIHQAVRVRDTLFNRYPKLKEWMQEIEDSVKAGYVIHTPWHRARRVPIEVVKGDYSQTLKMLREAVNAPIQGMLSDLVLNAMCNSIEAGVDVLAFLHDGYLAQADLENAPETMALMIRHIEESFPSKVKFYATGHMGSNWGDL